MTPHKIMLGIDVLTASKQRISWAFDTYPKICISFSGGKDSTVMFHLVMEEARKRNRKIAVVFIDWEAQYHRTITHVTNMLELYKDCIILFWICLPLKTVNATSQFEPEWICWEPGKENLWVRNIPSISISNQDFFPFYNYAMTFEEFIPAFEQWYADGIPTASFIGLRTQESLNRWRSICVSKKGMSDKKRYTTLQDKDVCEVFPIYDWTAEDIWKYHGETGLPYNSIYDLMYMAGVPLNKMRICEPYGLEQRNGLWLFQILEPDTWAKVVNRVSGANLGTLYVKERGNVMGNNNLSLPSGYTWKSFAMQILDSMPLPTSEHYKNKIAVYLRWYKTRGYPEDIPDFQDNDCKTKDDVPSWRRICKVLLRNDYWCTMLSFSPTKTSHYQKYLDLMKKRRETWNLI